MSLQVGDRDDSNLYISMKLKAAAEVNRIFFFIFKRFTCSVYTIILLCVVKINPNFRPKLLLFLMQIGINARHMRLPKTATEEEVRTGLKN